MTSPPPRWLRTALRLPRHLYRLGLGPLLGGRFLLLAHTGRRTGRRRSTVLEVVHRDPVGPVLVVVSGFGARADWLRNLDAGGPAEVTVGRARFPAEHRTLGVEEAESVVADYERRNRLIRPVLHRVLSRLLDHPYRGMAADRARLARTLPLVALRPRHTP